MNFKRYHVSKNLLDWSGNLITINGTVTTNQDVLSSMIDVSNINTLYFTGDPNLMNSGVYRLAKSNSIITSGSTVDSYSSNFTGGSYDVSDCNFLLVTASVYAKPSENRQLIKSSYMCNVGSTPQPYEPYSSEVWHDTPHYIHNTSADTLTTPAVIYANDTTATVGLKGQMEQSSTPSPSSPITPSECGERTGNLCLVSQSNSITYDTFNNYTISNNTVTSTGQALLGFKCKVEPNTSYTISIKKNTSADLRIREYSSEPTDWSTDFVIQSLNTNQTTAVITTTQNTTWILVTFWFSTAGHTVYDIMLNEGSTALTYEPWGIKIPILSNSQTTNLYLGEVQTTRKIKKLVLTGQETTWRITGSGRIAVRVGLAIPDNASCICTHFKGTDATAFNRIGDGECSAQLTGTGGYREIGFYSDTYTTLEAFQNFVTQQYAAGTPVCVWYVLAESTTGIVNEPLRKIGTYADEISNITIPVTAGANTISVDTTLQPSEVSVNYKGWHPVADVHERENGAWTE